ncbi:iron chelate uptake ABC transporter family permease subunit [Aliibacillus thermotolerans]|uniref:Iron chelate uptake ABC transporter family permease subunit n=1 Tax=Aliibacillus thermotolerans TaxID=1834418 RepID=A0ABW0U4K1_9BACI|nr:iron chelate uptake ABC transporter family permease subunit [Aliibacillus thermotolerans]MDA3130018.1 iron chelate uptake ABC transporter family permease subunit [Aliibacillus thermotolerans]
MGHKVKLTILACIAILLVAIFMFQGIGSNWEYILSSRGKKIVAIVMTGAAIAFSTVIFQTITNNRILTPSIIGLDALYLLIQTVIIFFIGSETITIVNAQVNFALSITLMVAFAFLLYHFLFRGEGRNIYFLLLIGIVFGTFFDSLSSFMQMLIDPNEFLIVQDRMFASFNNVATELIVFSLIIFVFVGIYFRRFAHYLDVLSLGKEHAINLGVPYDYVVKRLLIIIVVLISISTALVGPITFLGLLVANVAYEFMKTYRHRPIIISAIFISIIALVGGQLIVERVFTFSTTLSVIINFVGGVYFIYFLLKESRI